jgi:hypothetical protein
LTIKKVQIFIRDVLLSDIQEKRNNLPPEDKPWKLLDKHNIENKIKDLPPNAEERKILGKYRDAPPDLTIVWEWMVWLGWKYSRGKKASTLRATRGQLKSSIDESFVRSISPNGKERATDGF